MKRIKPMELLLVLVVIAIAAASPMRAEGRSDRQHSAGLDNRERGKSRGRTPSAQPAPTPAPCIQVWYSDVGWVNPRKAVKK